MERPREGRTIHRLRPRGRLVRPLHAAKIPKVAADEEAPDGAHRTPAGGGYRVLRRPRMLDSED